MRLLVFQLELKPSFKILLGLGDQLDYPFGVFDSGRLLLFLFQDELLYARLLPLIQNFRPFSLHLSFREWLLTISHALYVTQGLLLDNLELFDNLRIIQVNIGLSSHGEHFLRRPAEVHIHHADQVLFCELDLTNSYFVNLCILKLPKSL